MPKSWYSGNDIVFVCDGFWSVSCYQLIS